MKAKFKIGDLVTIICSDKIEYDALAKRAQLAFTIAWELANRENRPVVDKSGK